MNADDRFCRFLFQEVFVKLLTKFNLVLVVVFGLGIYLISHFAYDFLMEDARRQVLDQAKLMATSAQATLTYTDEEVSPVLQKTPAARQRLSGADHSLLRGQHDVQAVADLVSGLRDAGGRAEPDQSRRPGHGVGSGFDTTLSR